MNVVITGVAGFIGSQLAARWLAEGARVVGIDAFTDYYDPAAKRANVEQLADHDQFDLIEGQLQSLPLEEILQGCQVLYHQAAQPGVRASWPQFSTYVSHNIIATQVLLNAALQSKVGRFIYASSSSIYGDPIWTPTREVDPTRPYSPYGVTKLAAENLVTLYGENFGLPTVSLRYFTVYGPRQRPDMAIHRLINAALTGQPFPLYGNGSAIRDFTYVGDVVEANVAAATADLRAGTVVNIAGGSSICMSDLILLVGETVGSPVPVKRLSPKPGDVSRTGGNVELAERLLCWRPRTTLSTGLKHQVHWQRTQRIVAPINDV